MKLRQLFQTLFQIELAINIFQSYHYIIINEKYVATILKYIMSYFIINKIKTYETLNT
jgi:hypothetical protein